MFVIHPDIKDKSKGKGIQMTFANGNTISIQFGAGNYCENKNGIKSENENISKNAEVAIWNNSGDWYTFENGDTVKGYISADEVATWVQFAATTIF